MVPELLVLALDFYRSPLRYPHLTEPGIPLPDAFGALLTDFAAALSPQNLPGIAEQLGETPEAIESAARFFLRQVLLIPGADHYRVLGLPRAASAASIRQHYQLLIRLVHPDRSSRSTANAGMDVVFAVRINDAYSTLRHPQSRQAYDKTRSHAHGGGEMPPDIGAFLRVDQQIHHAISDQRSWKPAASRPRRWAIWTVLGGASLILITLTLLSQTSNKPVLRANPEALQVTEPMPRFLGQHDPIPAPVPESVSTPSVVHESPSMMQNAEPAKLPEPEQQQQQLSQLTVLDNTQQITPALSQPAQTPKDTRLTEHANTRPSQPEKQPALTDSLPDRAPPPPSPALASASPDNTKAAVVPAPTPAPAPAPAKQDSAPPPSAQPPPERLAVQTPAETPPRRLVELPRPSEPPVQPVQPDRSSPERRVDRSVEANALLRRFVNSYNAGSPDRLVALFTKDAKVAKGSGTRFIRQDYAAFFARLAGQRIDLAPIKWRSTQGGDLVGVANTRLVITERGSTAQQTFTGTLDFTLTGTAQGLRIASLMHRLQATEISRPDKPKAPTAKVEQPAAKPVISASEANAVVNRLTRAYRQGDINAITRLFTPDASVNAHSGIARIRRDYADFFQNYPERRISTQAFSWRTPNENTAIGRAGISIDVKAPGASDWINARGTMELELVRSQKSIKIKKMVHSLK